jgi:PAS domain S-box-containing protein
LQEQRRRDELRIREQAALLDKAQDAIFVYDLASHITYWNTSAERLYGWNSTEALNAEVEQILGNADAAGVTEVRQIVLEKGEWNGQLRQKTKDGREIVVESRCTRVCDEDGQPKAILVINSDVTERKKLETQLLRSQRMESIGTLAGGIAHDLNNVLSPVLMATQLLQMKPCDEKEKKFLSTIEVSAKRAADMVKQVLAFARGQEGDLVVLQVKHVIKDMEKIMRETFPRSINLDIFIAPNLPTIKGDATQLHQVILNLCVNARDAMPDGGSLSIKAEPKQLSEADAAKILNAKAGSYVCLTVTDTGTGMPPEVIERIYEPFFTTKELGKGTGLGLSTVLGIIKSHGGVIEVASTVGKGTTFTILFPSAEAPMAQETAAEAAQIEQGSGTILVIDDEPLIGAMAETILTMHGYRVLFAENGAEGIRLFQQHANQIEGVLCDMMMPILDGARAIAAMRKIRSDVPMIVMSGLAQGAQLPADANGSAPLLLGKPFTAERLLETIQRAVAPPPRQRAA